MNDFIYETVQPLTGTLVPVFSPESGQKITELTVTKVTDITRDDDPFETFSVELSGKEEEHCCQGNYTLKHESFGEATLFMCPHAVDQYQIIVSRKKSE